MNIEKAIRTDIKNELSKVTKLNSPNVYGMFHEKNGKINIKAYNILEAKIINMIIKNNTPAAAVIPLIESEND